VTSRDAEDGTNGPLREGGASGSGRFRARRAMVTGGAGGIGLAAAREFAAGGADVVLLDADEKALGVAAEDANFATIVADVRVADEIQSAVASAAATLGGPIDVLVNCAGVYRIASMVELDVAEWDQVLGVNLRGSWLTAREVVRGLMAFGVSRGSIVNVSSTAALVADATEPGAHYAASKAGVIALTRAMAVEWASVGIRANAVCPGVIDTPMLRMMDQPDTGRRYLYERVPLRRLGRPAEVARVIAFLASDEASYVTGVAVPIDGGATAT
jgi:NAD(P)-dependent dehydrogenase (short-subunit alcohol dehydrogenase family)